MPGGAAGCSRPPSPSSVLLSLRVAATVQIFPLDALQSLEGRGAADSSVPDAVSNLPSCPIMNILVSRE